MQPRAALSAALVACTATIAAAGTRRTAAVGNAASATWAIAQREAEAEYGHFWTSEWSEVESELQRLRRAADAAAAAPTKALSSLQVGASPTKGAPKDEQAKVADLVKQATGGKLDPAALAASMGAVKGQVNVAMLAPMLEMLKGLYQSGRDRIVQINKREKKSKERFAQYEQEHKARLARIDGKYKNHTISEEMYKNSTRDENHLYKYWPRCREREHAQFHNMLKLQHATMEKEKMMIDMYEKTIKGQATKDVQRKLGQIAGSMPDVVLVQAAGAVEHFCADALVEVAAARRELAPAAPPKGGSLKRLVART